jgi:CoA-transferase family III
MTNPDAALFTRIWSDLGGAPAMAESLTLSGGARLLPSVYDVGALATATVASALVSLSALHAARTGAAPRAVHVDREHAAVAFRSERHLTPLGWNVGQVWDPLAGDYRTRDGWIRLHTNYAHHRDAVLRALGVPLSREAVEAAVRSWSAEDLEAAVVGEQGCAARLRSAAEWAAHPQGKAVEREPLFAVATRPAAGRLGRHAPAAAEPLVAPLTGVRVLDLTRVMAGPVCTRLLAAYGADVLRIDPPGFEEVSALVPEMTAGKRRAFLDLRDARGRARFEELLASADVLVHGYRADALDRMELGSARRRALNPSLVDICHDAYGWSGPWAHRRGFDSLVQMSVGIAHRGREVAGIERPVPLPAQALDHACGYLLAAATCRALTRLHVDRQASEVRLSLARVARLLTDLGDEGDLASRDLGDDAVDRWSEDATSAFGPLRRVRCVGAIEGSAPRWTIAPGPLGAHAPDWRSTVA